MSAPENDGQGGKSKTGKWDNDAHANLCVGLSLALSEAGSNIHKHLDTIQAAVNINGLYFTGEAIRVANHESIVAIMPVQWDQAARAALFLSMSEVVAPPELTPEQKAKIESLMREKGYDISWNAIRQHLSKLKRNVGAGPASGDNAVGTPKTMKTGTPKSGGRGGKKGGGAKLTANKRKKGVDEDPIDVDDDDEDNFTPTKKVKAEAKVESDLTVKAEKDVKVEAEIKSEDEGTLSVDLEVVTA